MIRTEAMTMKAFLDLHQNTNNHQNDSRDCRCWYLYYSSKCASIIKCHANH